MIKLASQYLPMPMPVIYQIITGKILMSKCDLKIEDAVFEKKTVESVGLDRVKSDPIF